MLGLVLGGEALLERVRDRVGKKAGHQEQRWVTRADNPEARREAARALAKSLDDRSMKAWVRVRLGGERRVDVGQALGDKEGSAITHALKRLQARAAVDRGPRTELANIQKAFALCVSCIKSRACIVDHTILDGHRPSLTSPLAHGAFVRKPGMFLPIHPRRRRSCRGSV